MGAGGRGYRGHKWKRRKYDTIFLNVPKYAPRTHINGRRVFHQEYSCPYYRVHVRNDS